MRFLSKKSCLSLVLLGTMALVGCGGGGGGGGGGHSEAPLPTEAMAAKKVVAPIVKSASTILDFGKAAVPSSKRFSVAPDSVKFNTNGITGKIEKALDLSSSLRLVLAIGGGNIDSGLFMKEGTDPKNDRYAVAKFENGVYEKIAYKKKSSNSEECIPTFYCKVNGCSAEFSDKENKILKKLTIENGANFELKGYNLDWDFSYVHNKEKDLWELGWNNEIACEYSAKGTIVRGVSITMNAKAPEPVNKKYFYPLGKEITDEEFDRGNISWYYLLKDKQDIEWVCSFNDGFELNLTEYTTKEEDLTSNGDLRISVTGISGEYVETKRENHWVSMSKNNNQGYDEYYPYIMTEYLYGYDGLTLGNTEIVFSGSMDCIGEDNDKCNAKINKVRIKINDLEKPESGKFRDYVVKDAEAHVEIKGDYKDKDNKEDEFSIDYAKVDVTGLKYNYKEERNNRGNCFENSKVLFEIQLKDSSNDVKVVGDYDVAKKEAIIKVTSNDNCKFTEKNSKLTFNFKTVDIKATKLDVLADNDCEGAELSVVAIEKDGEKTERFYKVKGGRLVLLSSNDKQAPQDAPIVDIELPEELKKASPEEVVKANEEKLSQAKSEILADEPKAELKIVKNTAGLIIASYLNTKAPSEEEKQIETKLTAKDKCICSISYYSNELTFVFNIEMKDGKPHIQGKIFKGKDSTKTMDSTDFIGQFFGNDGNITVYINGQATTVSVM